MKFRIGKAIYKNANVPVFSGTESVQPVAMLAKAAGAQEPDPIVVDQSERNSL